MSDITLKLIIDSSGAVKAIEQVEGSVSNLGKELSDVKQPTNALTGAFANMAARAAGMFSVFTGIKTTLGNFVSEFNNAEKAAASLTQALSQQGIFTQATLNDMKAYASMLQELTGFEDDATIQIMAQLTAMGLRGEQLKHATLLSQDLATVMGTDMNSAARVMADAFSGNTTMLGRYIKGLDEADIKQRGAVSIIEQLNKAIGGQAEAVGNTGYGSIKKFEAAWGDLKERLGEIISNVLAPLLQVLSSLIKGLIDAPPFVHALTLGVVALAGAFTLLGTSMGGLPLIIGGIVTGVAMLGAWIGTMDKTAKATMSASDEIKILQDRINNLKVEAGQTKELDDLQRKLDALGKPTEFTLRSEVVKSQAAVDVYTGKLNEGKTVLSQILELEKQGRDVRSENPELADKYLKIFTDGNKKAEEQLDEYKDKTKKATEELKANQLKLDIYQKEKSIELAKEEADKKKKQLEKQKEDYKDLAAYKTKVAEETELLMAQSEEEETAIRRRQIGQRINDLSSFKNLSIGQQKELAGLELELAKLTANEEKRIKEELLAVSTRLRELEINAIADNNEREIAEINERYEKEIEAAGRNSELRAALEEELDAQIRAIRNRQKQDALEANNFYKTLQAGLVSGFQTGWNSIIDASMTGAEKWNAIWTSMKQAAWNAIGSVVQKFIEGKLKELFITKTVEAGKTGATIAGETARTGATQAGVLARIASMGLEVVASLAGAAASIVAAIANAIRWVFTTIPFPFSLALAGGAAAAIGAMFSGVKSAFGFEQGGVFKKGQRGFIEGTKTEIIQPEEDFISYLNKKIIPTIVNTTRIIAMQQPALAYAGNDAVLRELQEVKNMLKRKDFKIGITGTLNGQDFLRTEFPRSERFRKSILK